MRGTPEQWLGWLTGADDKLWKKATLILGGLTPSDDVAVEPLVRALRSESQAVVFWSAVALGRLQHRAAAAIPTLVLLAERHPEFGVRQAAVAALSKINAADPLARSGIVGALRDPFPFVRREALQAAIAFGSLTESEEGLIEQMRGDPDEAVSRWSEIALRNIREGQQRAV